MKRRDLLAGSAAGVILAATAKAAVSSTEDTALFEAIEAHNREVDIVDELERRCHAIDASVPAPKIKRPDFWEITSGEQTPSVVAWKRYERARDAVGYRRAELALEGAMDKARDIYKSALAIPAHTAGGLDAKIKAMYRQGVVFHDGLEECSEEWQTIVADVRRLAGRAAT